MSQAEIVERVKVALLSMQRHSWEQGVAAHAKVDAYGLVQGVCGAPRFDHSGRAPEGQAFFLLMEAAYRM